MKLSSPAAMRILPRFTGPRNPPFHRGPFTATIQTRFKKPADTAQTRLETRTRDPKLDLLAFHRRRLALVLSLYDFISAKKRKPFVSLQLLSRWAPHVGVNTLSGVEFMRKYPHVFEVFTHPVRRNLCCRFTSKFVELLKLEEETIWNMEDANMIKVRKILSMSVNGRVHVHAMRLIRRELGLPENFVDSVLRKHSEIFRFVDIEIVELTDWSDECDGAVSFSAEVEKWREKEYKEKWLGEFETKYAFPINFPTGFKIIPGFRERLKNWQRLSFVKPYERMQKVRARTCGGTERYEKRAVGIIHELLCLTVEKMVEVERLAHFRKDLAIEVNLRELLLKHPGIFYISTRGNTQMVFLREAYSKGCLVEPDVIYDVRRKLLELILLGCRNTRTPEEVGEGERYVANDESAETSKYSDFVLQIMENNSCSDIKGHG